MFAPRARILLVDDDDDVRDIMADLLQEEGYEIAHASNGREALSKMDWAPSLILLDLMMPVMNGDEFLAHLHEHGLGNGVPVILISAQRPSALAASRARCVLQKPVSMDALLSVVQSSLRR